MQIKRYEAKNMQEALSAIKAELGPEAIILKAKQKRGILGLSNSTGVEVIAAVTKNSLVKKRYAESKISKETLERLKNSKASVQKETFDKFSEKLQNKEELLIKKSNLETTSRKAVKNVRYVDIDEGDDILEDGTIVQKENVLKKINTNFVLKSYSQNNREIEEHSKTEIHQNIDEDDFSVGSVDTLKVSSFNWLNKLRQKLIFEDIDAFYTEQILNSLNEVYKSSNFDTEDDKTLSSILLRILSRQIKVENNILNTSNHDPKLFCFLGDKSDGKTTSLIKIASYFKQQNLSLGIICFDEMSKDESKQLDTLSKLSNIQTFKAQTLSELINILRELGDLDLILIDAEKTSLFSLDYPYSTHLILDSTKKFSELKSSIEKFKKFSPKSMILTKFDLLNSYGNIFNTCVYSKLPVSFVSLGKKVPEDLLTPSVEELAEMVLLKMFE